MWYFYSYIIFTESFDYKFIMAKMYNINVLHFKSQSLVILVFLIADTLYSEYANWWLWWIWRSIAVLFGLPSIIAEGDLLLTFLLCTLVMKGFRDHIEILKYQLIPYMIYFSKLPFGAHGYGSYFTFSILDRYYKKGTIKGIHCNILFTAILISSRSILCRNV